MRSDARKKLTTDQAQQPYDTSGDTQPKGYAALAWLLADPGVQHLFSPNWKDRVDAALAHVGADLARKDETAQDAIGRAAGFEVLYRAEQTRAERAERQVREIREGIERRVLERFIATIPANGEAPDYIAAITTAFIEDRALSGVSGPTTPDALHDACDHENHYCAVQFTRPTTEGASDE